MEINNKMKQPEECKNIEDIRTAIDIIDKNIVELISERAKYVDRAAIFKKDKIAVRDEKRVEAVIESKKALAREYDISPELIGEIYQKMIDYFINEELKKWEAEKLKD